MLAYAAVSHNSQSITQDKLPRVMSDQQHRKPTPPAERQVQSAVIEWQDDGSPYSPVFDDIYFSRAGGLAETEHVFLSANALFDRWQAKDRALANDSTAQDTFILYELGFGTGLNFLACWRLWEQAQCQHLKLHYVSCEKHPLTLTDLTRALAQWPELAQWRDPLLAQYDDHTAGCHRLMFGPVTLDLYFGDALTQLTGHRVNRPVDCWFLDGFTPPHNPALWQDGLLNLIARRAGPGTTVSSYSVTGRVVRALKAKGFAVEKPPGFGHKRQMLKATMPHEPPQPDSTAWHEPAEKPEIVVVGAGLAGATTAFALAKRGYPVTVIDAAEEVASGASGNPAAVVQLRLNRQQDAMWQFHLHCFLFARRFYQQAHAASGERIQWNPCGVLTLNSAYAKTRRRFQPGEFDHYPDSALSELTAEQCAQQTGFDLGEPGLYLPGGGTINPRLTTHYCLTQPGITLKPGSTVSALKRNQGRWHIYDPDQQILATADIVVLANSYGIQGLDVSERFPVTPLRGQISLIPATATSQPLQPVICSERYLTPAREGYHCVGASYVKGATSDAISTQEHQENREKLGMTGEALALPDTTPVQGRASFRGSSGDYLPLAGALPDPLTPERELGGTRHVPPGDSDKQAVTRLPGLFINAGHGSHGTVSCPLLAEHLASLISGDPSPLSQELAGIVDPWRFDERERKRLRKANKSR